jgi:hypothetical protein
MRLVDISAEDRAYAQQLGQPINDEHLVISREPYQLMQERGGRWAAYQNADITARERAGHLQFLKFGEGCTFYTPPPTYPKPTITEGTNYLLVGEVDFTQSEHDTRIKDYA